MMGLEDEEKKLALEYSHGMRKKLALAAALLPNPELLFLDEPFEGVDAVASRMLRDTLKRSVERGATVFLTSHILEIVESFARTSGSLPRASLSIRSRWRPCGSMAHWRSGSCRWWAQTRSSSRN